MLKALSMVAALAALNGCIDAKKSFNDYEGRIVDGNTSMPDRPNLTSIPDITGHFFLGNHIKGTPEDAILMQVADFTLTPNADGTAKVTYAASALKLPERTISAGPPAGPQFGASDMQVALDGTFSTGLTGKLPGDANPIQTGLSVTVAGTLHAEIHSADLFCGTMSGTAGPLSLDGSTFAAIRIPADTIGAALPTALWKCPDGSIDAGM
jgi:hypothetical protein